MYLTHVAKLDLPHLPLTAHQVHIVPDLASHTLVSIRQLCDVGGHVSFTATDVIVSYANQIVLTSLRTPVTRLWQFTMPTQAEPTLPEPIVETPTLAAIGSATPAELIGFAHATLFSPVLSALEEAFKKGYLTNLLVSLQNYYKSTLCNHLPWSRAIWIKQEKTNQ